MTAMFTKILLLLRLTTGSGHAKIWNSTGEEMQSQPGNRGDRQETMPKKQAGKHILYYSKWHTGNKACFLTHDFFCSALSSLSLLSHWYNIIDSRINQTIIYNVYDFLLHAAFYHLIRIFQTLSAFILLCSNNCHKYQFPLGFTGVLLAGIVNVTEEI